MKRSIAPAGIVSAVCAALSFCASAQDWPSKPVRVVSNSAVGSPGDLPLRLAAPRMGEALGQPVIVEPRPGGGGMLAPREVLKQGPDGYAILFSSAQIVNRKFLLKTADIDVLRDLAPVSLASQASNLIAAHAAVPARTFRELVEYSKKNPNKLTVSSNGIGSSLHTQWIGIMLGTGAQLRHVPYGTGNEAMRNNDFLQGTISASIIPYHDLRQHLEGGKVRVLATLTDARFPPLPDVPTLKEVQPDYDHVRGWHGFLAAAGTPRAIVVRLSQAVHKAYHDKELQPKFVALNVEAVGSTPEEFVEAIKRQEASMAQIVKAAGIKPQ